MTRYIYTRLLFFHWIWKQIQNIERGHDQILPTSTILKHRQKNPWAFSYGLSSSNWPHLNGLWLHLHCISNTRLANYKVLSYQTSQKINIQGETVSHHSRDETSFTEDRRDRNSKFLHHAPRVFTCNLHTLPLTPISFNDIIRICSSLTLQISAWQQSQQSIRWKFGYRLSNSPFQRMCEYSILNLLHKATTTKQDSIMISWFTLIIIRVKKHALSLASAKILT